MEAATDSVLTAYEAKDKTALPILVKKLCQLCEADLIGQSPKALRPIAYSLEVRNGTCAHTGMLYFRGRKAAIKIPQTIDGALARVSVAHELGHLIIHRRGHCYDEATVRLPSTPAEEALAEYCSRLLLMPSFLWAPLAHHNLAEFALAQSSLNRVTLHSAVTRLGDPDVVSLGVRGAILWRLNQAIGSFESMSRRLTPYWHLCPEAFVPVKKCKARTGSLIAELARENMTRSDSRTEEVSIGTFKGTFRVDAVAWGSVEEGTRLVLSVFRDSQ
jgi:hypothetical protein